MGFDDRLIYEIKRHELLYNWHHPDYRKLERKEEAWTTIAAAMKCTPELCRKRWKGLRDSYKRISKNYKYGDSSQRMKMNHWKYFDRLSFIKPYLRQERPPSSNMELINEECDGGFETVDIPSNNEMKGQFVAFQHKQEVEEERNDETSDFSEGLCVNRIEMSAHNPAKDKKNSTMMFFEVLGKKVVEANLPADVNMQLEAEVFQLVYGSIVNHKNLCNN